MATSVFSWAAETFIGSSGFWGNVIKGAAALAGAYVDSQIVAALSPRQRIQGPELELRVTAATEGAVIPRVYGSYRVGCNLIWATDLRYEEFTEGGKGSSGPEITGRRYFGSFACGLCEGPIAGVGRIWADGKLLAPMGSEVRVYLGTEDQAPDPWIEEIEGAGQVPAYRGLAYVVFEDIALEEFGNRIPQLTFEVFAPVADAEGARELITAVNLIPGAGEGVYATDVLQRGAGFIGGQVLNANSGVLDAAGAPTPDVLVSLDQLERDAPNVGHVQLVVAWFGDDLRAGECLVKPGVEIQDDDGIPLAVETSPAWSVDGVDRPSAYLISKVDDDPSLGANYGSTPSDRSVVQTLRELSDRNLEVTFYPFLLMDVPPSNTLPNPYSDDAATTGQAAFPWRGRITVSPAAGFDGTVDKTGDAATQVAAFFGAATAADFTVTPAVAPAIPTVVWAGGTDWGYRRMVLHYAHLCAAAGGVHSFIVGSELRGLTTARSDATTYPTVAQLIDLVEEVRGIFDAAGQTSTKISYAADWSEFFGHHPDDGSGDVFFHLDPLWAHADVDFVGIDNYVPLSDWRDGLAHADYLAGARSIYDRDYLQSNIEGGEGFDWYYASQADRDSQTRTPIADSAYGKPWVFRYKDHRSWWAEEHYDRPAGVESGAPTDWTPEGKPIRYTEIGCPAVDKGTNQPNLFWDPKSSESLLPYYSRAGGVRDDAIQRAYLEATLTYWDPGAGHNPVSSVYAAPMIDADRIAVWTWDARPFPAFPARRSLWGDAGNWRLGHWLNGRLGGARLGALVEAICVRAGVDPALIELEGPDAVVAGYITTAIESARASLAPLMYVYGFDACESGGVIRFVPRGLPPAASLYVGDLVASDDPRSEDLDLVRGQETELPRALKWRTIDPEGEFNPLTVEARRITVDTARTALESFPIAMPTSEADPRCWRALRERWVERETGTLALPPSRLAFDAADVVEFGHDGRELQYRLTSITDGTARRCELVRTDPVLYLPRPGPVRDSALPAPLVFSAPIVALMNLPQLDVAVADHQPYVAAAAEPWYGRAAVYRSPTTEGFTLLTTLTRSAHVGRLAFDFHAGPVGRFDHGNELWVDLFTGALAGVSDLVLFAGANALAVEASSGVWEIVQFGLASLEDSGPGFDRYKLTRLLRGQRGTDDAMGDPAPAGARVVVLQGARALPIAPADVGLPQNWRIGPAQLPVSDATYAGASFTPSGLGLRPFRGCQVRQPWKTARSPGDLEIAWKRQTRALGGDSWDAVEVALAETVEAYEVDIMDGGDVLRTLSASTPSVTYTGADQTTDWGAPLEFPDTLAVRIYQLSSVYGRGAPLAETLFF